MNTQRVTIAEWMDILKSIHEAHIEQCYTQRSTQQMAVAAAELQTASLHTESVALSMTKSETAAASDNELESKQATDKNDATKQTTSNDSTIQTVHNSMNKYTSHTD